MTSEVKHKPFCFAGEPAPCKGYFPDDVLPCVCTPEAAVAALSQQALPAPAGTPAPREASPVSEEPTEQAPGSSVR